MKNAGRESHFWMRGHNNENSTVPLLNKALKGSLLPSIPTSQCPHKKSGTSSWNKISAYWILCIPPVHKSLLLGNIRWYSFLTKVKSSVFTELQSLVLMCGLLKGVWTLSQSRGPLQVKFQSTVGHGVQSKASLHSHISTAKVNRSIGCIILSISSW